MLTREAITKRLRENYPYWAAEFGVGRIGLFGSFTHPRVIAVPVLEKEERG